ncbi:Clp protease-domain-containing protein [Limtongia smithiae]|uniref:Clp protease-domain-containing protein n=1 Tax=Limtongia smithiae TaxID=1125753 RepID=UPI0034CFBD2A
MFSLATMSRRSLAASTTTKSISSTVHMQVRRSLHTATTSLSVPTHRPGIAERTSEIMPCASQKRMITIPTVPDRDKYGGTMYFDIFSRLLKERIIMLHGNVESNMAAVVVSQLLFLEATDSTKPIYMYINSPGGEMHAGFSIIDTMQYIKCPVSTICVGIAGSMASLILVSGESGSRYALPHAWIMVHQPSSGMEGKASDLAIQARQILRMREQANRVYQDHLAKPYTLQQIEKLVENDNYLNSTEALELGIIDEVIKPNKPMKHGSGGLGPDTGDSGGGAGNVFSLHPSESDLPVGGLIEPAPKPTASDSSSVVMSSSRKTASGIASSTSAGVSTRVSDMASLSASSSIVHGTSMRGGPGLTNLPEDWWRKMFSV